LPKRIRTDNGVRFATNTLARLSKLSAWWVRLGVLPELIEPGKPQQNGLHCTANRSGIKTRDREEVHIARITKCCRRDDPRLESELMLQLVPERDDPVFRQLDQTAAHTTR
jgi:hypothetical protein